MYKFCLIFISILAWSAQSSKAQTILEEDFETGATQSQSSPLTRTEGWTTVNSYSGSNFRFNWFNEYRDPNGQTGPTINGAGCAACDAPISGSDGAGPREEILLTPELDLDDTYQLQFSWMVSPMNCQDVSKYDLQVRVVTDEDLNGAETVFSIQNEQMLRESGVLVFPINTWDRYVSKIDLSDWKGEKVKLAFVFKMFTAIANRVCIDDVLVKQQTPDVTPVPVLSLENYDFGDIYIGEKMYSEVIRMTNQGKNGLKVTGMDLPEGVGCLQDLTSINLNRYESVDFQFSYTSSPMSPAECEAVIHTNGGDVTVTLQANKMNLPIGCQLETFEGPFPPAGWKNNGWEVRNYAIEGDQSAFAGGDYSSCTLRSPRLDLSKGGQVTFTFYNHYVGDYAPEYDIELQVSYDGGDNWTTKWVSDYETDLNQLLTRTIELGVGSNKSYIRWFYPAVEVDDEGAFEHSAFYLDRVVLPNVYGADGVPLNATVVRPVNNATNVYPKDVVLEWGPAQFAKGYKLYVGSNTECNDLVDGLDVGNTFTYTIPVCDYETTYSWKVVGYNETGNSQTASTWKFTTQPDASVVVFPYAENFDNCTNSDPVPVGWTSTKSSDDVYNFAKWSPNTFFPYGGTGASLAAGHLNAGQSVTLTTPQFRLPDDGQRMSISFTWGNAHPSDLIIDETGLLKKENAEGGNGYDEVVFEIYCDGEWKQASYLSENAIDEDGRKYWRNETIDLDEYAGKIVQFRWIDRCFVTYYGYGTLDNVVINGTIIEGVAFNKESWDAGMVNYGKANSSKDLLTILNKGKEDLRVKQVLFNTDNFESSIQPGDELKPGEGMPFSIQFNALDQEDAVEDQMIVEFESGYTATFPVKGLGLAKDVLYYGFENNPLDYQWRDDFTMIDKDNRVNDNLGYYETVVENDGTKYAFTQVWHYNSYLLAHTGIGTLGASNPYDATAADDWLISKQIVPSENSAFDFYARNLSTSNSVFEGDNDYHSVEVLVSEDGNTKTTDFKTLLPSMQMEYLGENEWHHFEADLSSYAGKPIYVAVRHTTTNANAMAFFDDFTFTGLTVEEEPSGIHPAAVSANAAVEVYNLGGQLVATGCGTAALKNIPQGLYIVKVNDGSGVRTLRMTNN